MTSYGFSFRASARRDGGPGRLYLRVVHGGESRSVTMDYRVHPEEWDNTRRRLLIPFDRSARSHRLMEIENSMLGDLRRLDGVVQELERSGCRFTVEEIMTRYKSVVSGNTLSSFVDKVASELERQGRHRTAAAYRGATARLCEFSGLASLSHGQITPALLSSFQRALEAEGRSMNTISFYMRTLRSIHNRAVAAGVALRRVENPFAGVYTGVSQTRKRALSPLDLAMLSALDPTARGETPLHAKQGCSKGGVAAGLPDNLQTALAIFLFCYHARGMCFVDLANLKKSDLRGDVIRYRRAKTGQTIELLIVPQMRAILDWFEARSSAGGYLFPVITDPEGNLRRQYESGLRLQNLRLKRVAALCGIKGRLTTHVARHSWATTAKSAGLPLAVISEGLGHSNQRTTEIYLASLERSLLDRASRIVSAQLRSLRSLKI